MSEARIAIPADSLRSLPPGAEYRSVSGQASAVVRTSGDTVYVYAVCDSLQRLVERYERESSVARTASEDRSERAVTAEERRTDTRRKTLTALIAGVAAGIAMTIVVKTKIRKI